MRSSWPAYCVVISAWTNEQPELSNSQTLVESWLNEGLTTRVRGRGPRAKVSAAHVADHTLVKAQDVAFGVGDPGCLFVAHDAHVVDGLDLWRVVVEEAHSAILEVLDLVGDVLDLKGQHGVSALCT